MAENTRGMERDGQNSRDNNTSRNRQDTGNAGRDQNVSTNRGLADMDSTDLTRTNRRSGSGISTKKSITGSDYDGQLSDE